MSQKQQVLMNYLNKLVRQYFVYHNEPTMDQIKVRLRTDLHRVEQGDKEDHDAKILQRGKEGDDDDEEEEEHDDKLLQRGKEDDDDEEEEEEHDDKLLQR
ncbi:hypothetical protein ACOMHN_032287 [Nucella lapillus]